MVDVVERLRKEIAKLALPYAVPGVDNARKEREFLLSRLDGYVLPRLRRMDAPLLVVIGGSTGAGKSTLTNSLIGVRISPAGVLRPTTRAPVLVHHPGDADAFLSRRILPGLVRTTMSGARVLEPDGASTSAQSIRLVPHEEVAPGLAIIDSPDLDSVVDANRALARQLFGVADLWVFVTTGTDYANAMPWELLTEAVDRQVSVAVVLDRMRESEIAAVRVHFATMLRDRGLAAAPVFAIRETALLDGLLPAQVIAPLQKWLNEQTNHSAVGERHVSEAVSGTIKHVVGKIQMLVEAAAEQARADQRLREDLESTVQRTKCEVAVWVGDGSVIDDRLRMGWQAIAGSQPGDGMGRLRQRMNEALHGSGPRYQTAAVALQASVVAGVREHARGMLSRVSEHWRSHLALDGAPDHPDLAQLPEDFTVRAEAMVRHWQTAVFDGVRPAGDRARGWAWADPAVLAITTLAVGADTEWVGPVARLLLEAEAPQFEAAYSMAVAREDLRRRLVELLEVEQGRLAALLDDLAVSPGRGESLRAAADEIGQALAATD